MLVTNYRLSKQVAELAILIKMAHAHDSKFSFLASHRRSGRRHEVIRDTRSASLPTRTHSFPELGIPAGFSQDLGNRLAMRAYASLGARWEPAKLSVSEPIEPLAKTIKLPKQSEERGMTTEKLRPELLPPAGRKLNRPSGLRIVQGSAGKSTNADLLLWGKDFDGTSGIQAVSTQPMFSGAAGARARADRIPPWGEVPPDCYRTFGSETMKRLHC